MHKLIAFIIAILLAAAGYHFWFSADAKHMREVQTMLDSLAADVQTLDKERIIRSMRAKLADPAEVVLEVRIIAPVGQKVVSAVKQNFDKESFIQFVDNILYSMREYKLNSRVNNMQAQTVLFDSTVAARGMSAMLMQQDYQFSGSSNCSLQMEGSAVKHLDCVLEIR